MSSFKNKINNKKRKKRENEAVNELVQLKKKMKAQYEAREYVSAMDTMAEIARHKTMDPEIMAMGANCYFETGDYERATTWINNTLSYDPNNISARLLLGRLCFMEDKPKDGFAVLSFVVEKFQSGMKEEDKTKLLDMLGYFHDNMEDMMNDYPALVDYYNGNCVAPEKTAEFGQGSTIQDMLEASLSPKEDDFAKDDIGEKPVDGKSKAQAAVDRLKALLNKSKGKSSENGHVETKVDLQNTTTGKSQNEKNVGADNTSTAEVENMVSTVANSDLSMKDKIRALNNFASGLYLNNDYHGAVKLLSKALEMDSHDPFVLRNISYVCLAMGDKDQALEYASKLPMVDFALIKTIKGHCHE